MRRHYLFIFKDGLAKYMDERAKEMSNCYDKGFGLLTPNSFFLITAFYSDFSQEIREIQKVLEFIGIQPPYLDLINHRVSVLTNTSLNLSVDKFIKNLSDFCSVLHEFDDTVKKRLSKFDDEQTSRLDEALTNYFEQCYFSSVVMSVSALEHLLAKIRDGDADVKKLYDETEKRTPTFGVLIKFFFDNIKNPIIKKYSWLEDAKYLLGLCNDYRVFSAHPKGKDINNNIANSILCLTFEFFINVRR